MQTMMSNAGGKHALNRVGRRPYRGPQTKRKYREAIYGSCNERDGTHRSEYLRWKEVRKIKKEMLGYIYAWVKR